MRGIKQLIKLNILLFLSLTIFFSLAPEISAAYIKTTTDPMRIGVGARALGMGKAFVGLADDSTALFMNPGGLAQLDSWQVTSMSTKLINEIDYLTFGGVYPTEYGNIGFGYIGASISGSFITDFSFVEDPDGRIYPVATAEALTYSNSVVLFSYATEAKRFSSFEILGIKSDNLMLGANFKLFSQGLSGVTAGGGNASGMDVDIGALYTVNDWMKVGVNFIDFLPPDMGGKLVYQGSTLEESIPEVIKLGTAVKIMGDKGLYPSDQDLYGMLDIDTRTTQALYPQIMHLGLEYWPNEILALRFGIDQDVAGRVATGEVELTSNLCAGVGFLYEGFRFDYAYHQYGGVQSNDTHYMSVSYGFVEPKPEVIPEKPKVKTYFMINSPVDKSVVYDEEVKVSGIVTNLDEVRRITVNDVDIPVTLDGSFEVASALNLGKNVFEVKAFNTENIMLKKDKIRVLRMIRYKDVADDYWAREVIEYLSVLGMVGGYPDGTFRPNKKINRAEFTTLLVRSKGLKLPEVSQQLFKDMPKTHWAAKYIQVGVDEKLITGYPDKTFKPNKDMNRSEGVTVFARFSQLELPEILVEGPFADVPGRHWAAKAISAAKVAGLLNYLAGKPFGPNNPMTRAEAVEIMSKTPFAAGKIDDLKNFDTY